MELSAINISTVKYGMLQYAVRAMEFLGWLFSKKIKLFELCGVELSLNITAILLPAVLVASCGLGWFVVIVVFEIAASILLHEAGHALGGFIVGNPAREIGLIACGGYTRFAKMPGATASDALVCLCGPLANALTVFALILAETCILGLTPLKWLNVLLAQVFWDSPSLYFMPESFHILNTFAMINMYMLLFNLVPAFPLDGGRCFRVLAGRFLPPLSAASLTMIVSRFLACAIVVRGVIIDLILDRDIFDMCFLTLVALWIWWGSLGEVWRTEEEEASSTLDPLS